jgi:hypothetical protein
MKEEEMPKSKKGKASEKIEKPVTVKVFAKRISGEDKGALVAGSFWSGKVPCWQMCFCPPVIKEECPSPRYESFACWEIEGTWCKLSPDAVSGSNTALCETCIVYRKYGEGRPIDIKLKGKGIGVGGKAPIPGSVSPR